MSQESSVGKVEEVVPGSENDPFSKNYKGSPAPVQPAPTAEPPVSQPDELKPSGAVDDIAAILARPEVSEAIGKQVAARLEKAQSGLNKRDAQMTKQLETARKEQAEQQVALTRLQREVQVANLSPEERAQLAKEWAAEDRMKEADAAYAKVSEYHKAVEARRLVIEYGPFGFTPEMIDEEDTLEDMELKAKDTRIAFLESGGKPAEKPAGPAAANAPSDVGGGGPAPQEFKLGTGQGIEAMAANLKASIERPEQFR